MLDLSIRFSTYTGPPYPSRHYLSCMDPLSIAKYNPESSLDPKQRHEETSRSTPQSKMTLSSQSLPSSLSRFDTCLDKYPICDLKTRPLLYPCRKEYIPHDAASGSSLLYPSRINQRIVCRQNPRKPSISFNKALARVGPR
jgi:hypothetical protein